MPFVLSVRMRVTGRIPFYQCLRQATRSVFEAMIKTVVYSNDGVLVREVYTEWWEALECMRRSGECVGRVARRQGLSANVSVG